METHRTTRGKNNNTFVNKLYTFSFFFVFIYIRIDVVVASQPWEYRKSFFTVITLTLFSLVVKKLLNIKIYCSYPVGVQSEHFTFIWILNSVFKMNMFVCLFPFFCCCFYPYETHYNLYHNIVLYCYRFLKIFCGAGFLFHLCSLFNFSPFWRHSWFCFLLRERQSQIGTIQKKLSVLFHQQEFFIVLD